MAQDKFVMKDKWKKDYADDRRRDKDRGKWKKNKRREKNDRVWGI